MTKCAIPGCGKAFMLNSSLNLLEHLFCWHIGSNEAVRCADCGYGAKWHTSDFRNHFRSRHNGVVMVEDRRHLFSIKTSELLQDYYPDYLDQCQETIKKWKAAADSSSTGKTSELLQDYYPDYLDQCQETIKKWKAAADSSSTGTKRTSTNADDPKTARVKVERLPSTGEQQSRSTESRKRQRTKRYTSDAVVHPASQRHPCSYCGMSVARHNFSRHAFAKHSDVPAFQCPYCDFRNNCSHMVVSTHVQEQHPDQPIKVVSNSDISEQLITRCFPGYQEPAGSSRRRSGAANRSIVPPSPPPEPEALSSDRSSNSRASTGSLRERRSAAKNKSLDCRKCGAQVQDTVADRAEHFFKAHGQGKARRYQCPYCSDGDRDIESTLNVHIQLKHPGRKVVTIDRADKEKYCTMIDELFETEDDAKRSRVSTPNADQMPLNSKLRSAHRDPPVNDDVVTVYEKRRESATTQRPMLPFGNTAEGCGQFNMQQAMMPMLGNCGMGGMMMPFMPAMMQQLQSQNMTMMMMPMIVPIDFMQQMNQTMLPNGAFGQSA
uniref:C2H2-type domain-containing protein n=2 Tax=Plectus sambesii TaxID=2011161 RepID=A0A914WR72_9BILA